MGLIDTAKRPIRTIRDAVLVRLFTFAAKRRLNRKRPRQGHDLPGELIVSLTSYPSRFATLHLTLACLLDQTVRPDRVVLWIAEQDVDELPPTVTSLEAHGLEIRTCDDLRSYKKLVPALRDYPDAWIATADDDVYYGRRWLAELVQGLGSGKTLITCHRAHRIRRDRGGKIAPYLTWRFDVQDDRARRPSTDLLPTGVGGILYPPGSLDSRVEAQTLFQRLSPAGDDLWFYWCARLAGAKYRKVGGKLRLVSWPATQEAALWNENEGGPNDRAIAALEREFPLPADGVG